jgi:predicted DNA-binding helix-hairpin-helix protein
MEAIDAAWILQTSEAIGIDVTLAEAEALARETGLVIRAARSEVAVRTLEDEPAHFELALKGEADPEGPA